MRKVFCISILGMLLVFSCNAGMEWPQASVSVKSTAQRDESGARYLVVRYSLTNTCSSVITRSTVSFSANTATQSYYFTHVGDIRILPGNTVYLTAEQRFIAAAETLTANSLEVRDYYFE